MGFCVFENLKSHRKVKKFVIFRTPLNHICDFKSTSDLKSCDFQNMPDKFKLLIAPPFIKTESILK